MSFSAASASPIAWSAGIPSPTTRKICSAPRGPYFSSGSALCYDADFYPFGGERAYTNSCAQNYKFEGKERDTETNNDDFGARYYSSAFGRWTSPDWSAIPVPVPYANLTNPQTLNLYAMVSDNPETFADLDGHCGMDIGCWISVGIGIANGIQRDGGVKPYAKNLAIGAAKGAGTFALNAAKAVAAGTNAGAVVAAAMMPGPKALQPSNQTQAQASTGTQIGLAVASAVVPAAAAEGSAEVATTTVMHFTNDTGVMMITEAGGVLNGGGTATGTFVTPASGIPAGATAPDIESLLEIGPGKGTNSITFDTPNSNLVTPANGPTTSGGAQQFQLQNPTQVDVTQFKPTPQ